jgi:hypothetical protein
VPSQNRATVRPCPICSIAMQASKSRDDLEHFDVFECQHCGAVITEAPQSPPDNDRY